MAEYSVKTYAELVDAINAANASAADDTIALTADIAVTGVLPTLGIRDAQGNVIASGALTIDGNDHTLSGGGQHRLLFANAGTIVVNALTLAEGLAQGGNGGDTGQGLGGGGGMGAGGGLYIRAGANVTLSDVTFSDNAAAGGRGGNDGNNAVDGLMSGGGGGLGGNGGASDNFRSYGAGGGAFAGQDGGTIPDPAGGVTPDQTGRTTGGGPNGGFDQGGDFSGGGGGTIGSAGGYGGGGGGGGVGGSEQSGGKGGFGGGGGGGGGGRSGGGGTGGPGDGGFGGGGGGQSGSGQFGTSVPGVGGFGGGTGGSGYGKSAGGGGAAFGAGIFVQEGGSLTIAGNGVVSAGSLTEGSGGPFAGTGSERAPQAGQSAGSSLFLQGSGTLTYAPNAGQSISIFGSIEDQVGFVARTGYAPNTGTWSGTERWALTLDGPGTLMLGSNSYSGGTLIRDGRLQAMEAGAIGTGNVVFDAGAGRFAALALFGQAEPVDATLSNTLVDFGYGSALELIGLAYTGPGSTTATVSNGVLTVANPFMSERFDLGGQSGSSFATASNGNNGTVVGIATTGQISVTDGASYNPDNDRDVTLVVYGGTDLEYSASVTGSVLTVDNGRVSEAINLGTSAHGLSLDFSTNTSAVRLSGGESGDSLRGGRAGDTLAGGGGADTLDGGLGADSMTGGTGNDSYIVDNAGDQVVETAGGGNADAAYVRGNAAFTSYTLAAGQDIEVLATTRAISTRPLDLTGNEKGQTLYGNAGANVLDGGGGADQLVGGAGADTFVFSTTLGATNVDRIVDFSAGDAIRLSKSIFAELDLGTLSEGAFKDLGAAGAAVDADDRILYDAKGRLFYDEDGAGGSEAVLFARVSYRPELGHDDFLVA